MREKLLAAIDSRANELAEITNFIFNHPEVGNQEYQACALLCKTLEDNGFTVEAGVGGLDTAFRAVYQKGNGGVSFGLLCEYDALDAMGHACGHQMQGPVMLGAALALKEVPLADNYKIVVYGTPAEETTSGKIQMLREGCFQDIDIALMMHGHSNTTVNLHTLNVTKFTVTFHGTSAHAAAKPEMGRSALDALLLSFNGIEFLREHVRDDVRIHYTVLDAGGAENAVPKFAKGSFRLRSLSTGYLKEVIQRFENIMQGAALMTGTTVDIHMDKEVLSRVPVPKINELLMKHAAELNAPNIAPPPKGLASNDFGNVSHVIPSGQIKVSFVPVGTPGHSQAFLDASDTPAERQAVLLGAKIIALTCKDILDEPELLETLRAEHAQSLKEVL